MMHTHMKNSSQSPSLRQATGTGWVLIGVIAVGLLVVLFLIGFLPRMKNREDLAKTEDATVKAVPILHTVIAKPAPFSESGYIPGNISAIQFATIYARVDGYLKSRMVDIGDKVKTGQLLAEIETPTIDAELAQAKADLAEAKAQLVANQAKLKQAQAQDVSAQAEVQKAKADESYTEVTAHRWENMAGRGAVTLQSRDEKVRAYKAQTAQVQATEAQKLSADQNVEAAKSEVDVAQSQVEAKKASVQRVQANQSFKFVRAPFDGVITLRKVDPGALITAGSQSSNLELFQLAKIEHLRTYVNVPQTVARYLQAGQKAVVQVPEFPERNFEGVVTNVAGGLDPTTRTRQTEIHIENLDHTLLPGMYCQVKITIARPESWVRIPGPALVPLDDGMNVVVVHDNKAHFQKVAIGRDFGDEVEIKAGINDGDVVAVSPPVDLRDGETVTCTPLNETTEK
jgi:RND family efflux transporter MFP subunit